MGVGEKHSKEIEGEKEKGKEKETEKKGGFFSSFFTKGREKEDPATLPPLIQGARPATETSLAAIQPRLTKARCRLPLTSPSLSLPLLTSSESLRAGRHP